jgi:hypothetical protein
MYGGSRTVCCVQSLSRYWHQDRFFARMLVAACWSGYSWSGYSERLLSADRHVEWESDQYNQYYRVCRVCVCCNILYYIVLYCIILYYIVSLYHFMYYVWIVFIVWLYLLYLSDLPCVLYLLYGVHAVRELFDSSFGWFASDVNCGVNFCNKIFAKQFGGRSC